MHFNHKSWNFFGNVLLCNSEEKKSTIHLKKRNKKICQRCAIMLQIYRHNWMHLFDEKRNIKFWIKSKRPSIIWWKIESTFQLVLLLSSCSTHVLVLISSQYYSLSECRYTLPIANMASNAFCFFTFPLCLGACYGWSNSFREKKRRKNGEKKLNF